MARSVAEQLAAGEASGAPCRRGAAIARTASFSIAREKQLERCRQHDASSIEANEEFRTAPRQVPLSSARSMTDQVLLRACDGTVIALSRSAAEASTETLCDWLECVDDAAASAFLLPFSASAVSSACSMLEATRLSGTVLAQAITDQRRSVTNLCRIISVLHFLGADDLMDNLSMAIGLRLNGLWDVELRDELDAECDLTERERSDVIAESVGTRPRRASVLAADGVDDLAAAVALRHVNVGTLRQLKLVSKAWQQRARRQLRKLGHQRGYRSYCDAFREAQMRKSGGVCTPAYRSWTVLMSPIPSSSMNCRHMTAAARTV